MKQVYNVEWGSITVESGMTLGVYSPDCKTEIRRDERFPAYRVTDRTAPELFNPDATDGVERFIVYADSFSSVVKSLVTGFPVFSTPVYFSYRDRPLREFIADDKEEQ